ncbi:MAG: hypothetical protein ACKVZ0_05450 [Gemmatimonadales bacterium]
MDPLPFRLMAPGQDVFEGLGVRSVSVKVEGLAHWSEGILTLEWSETQHIDEVSVTSVRSDVVVAPPLAIDIPVDVLAKATVVGGWWRPRLELRARYLDAFAHVPGAKPGRLELRIKLRDRGLAKELAADLEQSIVNHQLATAAERPAIEP